MKPCPKNKQSLVWLCTGNLDPLQCQALQSHLQTCPGCRAYHAQISMLTRHLENDSVPAVTPSPSFHLKLQERITRDSTAISFAQFVNALPLSLKRVWTAPALAFGTILLVIAGLLFKDHYRDKQTIPNIAAMTPLTQPDSANNPAPTLATYHSVAADSLDALDELLLRTGSYPRSEAAYKLSSITRLTSEN